ncbi:MAG: hypothetical protein WB610_01890, partial [Rhodomicrobium sp.]
AFDRSLRRLFACSILAGVRCSADQSGVRETPEYKTAISEKQMGWVCAISASVLIAGAVSR